MKQKIRLVFLFFHNIRLDQGYIDWYISRKVVQADNAKSLENLACRQCQLWRKLYKIGNPDIISPLCQFAKTNSSDGVILYQAFCAEHDLTKLEENLKPKFARFNPQFPHVLTYTNSTFFGQFIISYANE